MVRRPGSAKADEAGSDELAGMDMAGVPLEADRTPSTLRSRPLHRSVTARRVAACAPDRTGRAQPTGSPTLRKMVTYSANLAIKLCEGLMYRLRRSAAFSTSTIQWSDSSRLMNALI